MRAFTGKRESLRGGMLSFFEFLLREEGTSEESPRQCLVVPCLFFLEIFHSLPGICLHLGRGTTFLQRQVGKFQLSLSEQDFVLTLFSHGQRLFECLPCTREIRLRQ